MTPAGGQRTPGEWPIRVTALFIRAGRLLVIRRERDGRRFWTFIGGNGEEGESPAEALLREVREETGWDLRQQPAPIELFTTRLMDGREAIFYQCECGEGEPVLGGPELQVQSEQNHYTFEWISSGELNTLVQQDLVYPRPGQGLGKILRSMRDEQLADEEDQGLDQR